MKDKVIYIQLTGIDKVISSRQAGVDNRNSIRDPEKISVIIETGEKQCSN